MNTRSVLACCLLLLCPALGCSQMRVQVELLDKRYQNEEPYVEAVVSTQAARAQRRVAIVESGREQYKRQINQAISKALSEAAAGVSATRPAVRIPNELLPNLTRDLIAELDERIDREIDRARSSLDDGLNRIAEASRLNLDDPGRRQKLLAAQKSVMDAEEIVKHLRSVVGADAGEIFQKLSIESPQLRWSEDTRSPVGAHVAKAARDAASSEAATLTSNNIFNDPLTSAIVSAPDDFWHGVYNRTYGLGTLGNTDIAIKMESVGNFTVKGVREDASKITPAAFQGIQQALKVAAGFAGVPLPSSAASASGAASGASSGTGTSGGANSAASDLATADADAKAARLKLVKSRAAALSILTAIVNNHVVIDDKNTSPDSLSKAVKDIKDTFSQAKGDLEMD